MVCSTYTEEHARLIVKNLIQRRNILQEKLLLQRLQQLYKLQSNDLKEDASKKQSDKIGKAFPISREKRLF